MSVVLIILVSSNICSKDEEYSRFSHKCEQILRYIKPAHKPNCLWCNLAPEIEAIKKNSVKRNDIDSSTSAPAILNLFDIPKYAAAMKKKKSGNKNNLSKLVDRLYLHQI